MTKTEFKVGDFVVVHNFDVGVITHIDEENQSADVEIEHYDYKTELPYKFTELRKF